jgi:predicted phage terminase large subunit-like protein
MQLSLEHSVYLDIMQEALPIFEAQASFYEFVKQAWKVIEPRNKFIDGMHIRAMCEHLQGISTGQIERDMIFNIPPRCSKSTIVCVMWPAWDWIENPQRKFLYAAHSMDLAVRDSVRCRDLIQSDWYQRNWGHLFVLRKKNEDHIENNCAGYRRCTSPSSQLTGQGGDIVVVDDLNDTSKVLSDAVRGKTNVWFSATLSTRLNNLSTGRIIIAAQRCHELDVSGYARESGMFVELVLPMEFESNRKCKTVPLRRGEKPWEDPRVKEGELLWPQNIGPAELVRLKKNLKTEYSIAGQLQQRPSPEEGGIIKKSYFKWWKQLKPPKLIEVIQSWDTALTTEDMKNNSFSACTTWGIFEDFGEDQDNISGIANIILLDCWRGKVEYPELRRMAQRLAADYKDKGETYREPDGHHVPNTILVEAKASGSPLIQDLRKAGVQAIPFYPEKYGDKTARVRLCTPIMECGRVWLAASPYTGYKALLPFAEAFQEQCCLFPNAEARDYVDSMTQVLLKTLYGNVLYNSSDPKRQNYYSARKKNAYGVDED